MSDFFNYVNMSKLRFPIFFFDIFMNSLISYGNFSKNTGIQHLVILVYVSEF